MLNTDLKFESSDEFIFSYSFIDNTDKAIYEKEDWIKDASDFLISNMALFLIPFWGALIVYEDLLAKNALVILLVVFITTILTIVGTGLFVEFGIKYLRLKRIKKHD